MADEISQVVEVFISRETAQIDTASFDIPLLMVNLPDTVDNTDPENPVTTPADVTLRVQQFTSLTAVGEAFGITSNAYKMTQKLLGGDIRPSTFMIGLKNSSETYTAGLQAIMAYNNDWYAIAIDSKVDGDIKEVAAVIQAERKIFGASSADIDILDPLVTDDIGSFLKDGSYDRTFLVYHPTAAADFPEVGWIGGQIAEVPGSNTWNFKGAPGVQVTKLTTTQINTLEAKSTNYYSRLGGVNMFRNGVMSEGSFIDVIIGLDWLQARIQEQVFYRLATKKKIPYTAAGAMMVEAEIRSVLSQGVANGLIADAPAYTVQSPDVLAIPEVTRAQRILGDFLFQARLAGGIHKVIVRGTVTA